VVADAVQQLSAIQVGVRCRPLIGRDTGQPRCFDTHDDTLQLNGLAPCSNSTSSRKGEASWTFDNVFDENCSALAVHERLTSGVVSSVLAGFHGTIFAYGQTGSGKTYTMVGDQKNSVPGVMSHSVDQITSHIAADCKRKYMMRVSYIECYMEKIRDLLNPGPDLKIRGTFEQGFYVDCKEVAVTDSAQIFSLLGAGDLLRTTGATLLNDASSRSHAIFRITLESEALKAEKGFTRSYLNLVDLAGSERNKDSEASGDRLKEGATINQSLSTLSHIIRGLSRMSESQQEEGEAKVKLPAVLPFRDSYDTQA
jgi:centromeric protein E